MATVATVQLVRRLRVAVGTAAGGRLRHHTQFHQVGHHVVLDRLDQLRVQRLVQAQQGRSAEGVDPVAHGGRQNTASGARRSVSAADRCAQRTLSRGRPRPAWPSRRRARWPNCEPVPLAVGDSSDGDHRAPVHRWDGTAATAAIAAGVGAAQDLPDVADTGYPAAARRETIVVTKENVKSRYRNNLRHKNAQLGIGAGGALSGRGRIRCRFGTQL